MFYHILDFLRIRKVDRFPETFFEFAKLVVSGSVLKRQHREPMSDGLEFVERLPADPHSRGIRSDESGIFLFDLFKAFEQCVIFAVGDYRIILYIIAMVVVLDDLPEKVDRGCVELVRPAVEGKAVFFEKRVGHSGWDFIIFSCIIFNMVERIIQSYKREDESEPVSLRPRSLEDYVGQKRVKDILSVALKAAKNRDEALDHVLFYGPPGLGKTTLAHIIANELDVTLVTASGPTLEKAKDVAAILTNLGKRDVLFIDEIHRMNRAVEETLYGVMEDFVIDIVIGSGPHAKCLRLPIEPFTLIGATTRAGLLTGPLRDRFGIVQHLEFYSVDELVTILNRSAKVLDVKLTPDGAKEIGKRARGTPRIANRLLKRVRDWAQVMEDGKITVREAVAACESLGIDEIGLDPLDRKLLSLMIDYYGGGPVGIETLAATLNEERDTITDVMEPFLLKIGFLQRTPRGRCITRGACEHLKMEFPFEKSEEDQGGLFEE